MTLLASSSRPIHLMMPEGDFMSVRNTEFSRCRRAQKESALRDQALPKSILSTKSAAFADIDRGPFDKAVKFTSVLSASG